MMPNANSATISAAKMKVPMVSQPAWTLTLIVTASTDLHRAREQRGDNLRLAVRQRLDRDLDAALRAGRRTVTVCSRYFLSIETKVVDERTESCTVTSWSRSLLTYTGNAVWSANAVTRTAGVDLHGFDDLVRLGEEALRGRRPGCVVHSLESSDSTLSRIADVRASGSLAIGAKPTTCCSPASSAVTRAIRDAASGRLGKLDAGLDCPPIPPTASRSTPTGGSRPRSRCARSWCPRSPSPAPG